MVWEGRREDLRVVDVVQHVERSSPDLSGVTFPRVASCCAHSVREIDDCVVCRGKNFLFLRARSNGLDFFVVAVDSVRTSLERS